MEKHETLYERVLIELVEDSTKEEGLIKGIEKPGELIKVKVVSWGTNVDGTAFLPGESDNEAYVKVGVSLTPFGEKQFIMDRRFILTFERNK